MSVDQPSHSYLAPSQVSTRWSQGGEESTEATLNPRRYFVYLANGHWTERPLPDDLVALAAERVARILQAPPLVFEWLRRLAGAVASGEAQMPHGLGFGVVRDAQRRLAGARLYLQNGPYGTLPDLPLRWPLSPVWNASAAQRLSELLDLAEPHQIAALEWTRESPDTIRFRQYIRLDHGPSTRSAIALAGRVVAAIEHAKRQRAPAGSGPKSVAADLREFAMAVKADVEVMGSSVVTAVGTPPVEVSKVGLFVGRLMDAARREELFQLIQRTIHLGAAGQVRGWLNATSQAYPGTLHVVNVAFGLSSDRQPNLAVYQAPAAEESVCTRSAPPEESSGDLLGEESRQSPPPPPEVTTLVDDSDAEWPPPPEDVGGAIQLMMGQAEGDARAFFRATYQSSVLHTRRPLAPAHFEDRLMGREEVRAALGMLASRGLLAANSRAHQKTKLRDVARNATAESILDETVAKQKQSVVVTLDALLEAHGIASAFWQRARQRARQRERLLHDEEAQRPSERLRSLVAGLRRALGTERIGVNLYLSAAGDTVLPAHTDKYDVFVLQLWGRKAWKTCVPLAGTLSPLSEAERAEMREVQLGKGEGCTNYAIAALRDATIRMADDPDSSGLQCTERQMEPGDALYLPKGVVHAAYTDEAAPAAHLTIAVPMQGRTWGDLLTHAANAVAAESRPASEVCAVRAALHHAIKEASQRPEGVGWRNGWYRRPATPTLIY